MITFKIYTESALKSIVRTAIETLIKKSHLESVLDTINAIVTFLMQFIVNRYRPHSGWSASFPSTNIKRYRTRDK